jgi:X-Pro dipeptidyl-peptidase
LHISPAATARYRHAAADTERRSARARFTDDASIPALTLANATTGEHRSRFETAPFATATRMSGTATARVRLTFTGVANVTALLVDRAPDGTATIVTRAWTDPRNRVSEWFSQPVLPGMPYDLKLTFMPRDYTLAAGHTPGRRAVERL